MLFGMMENELRLRNEYYVRDPETGKVLKRPAAFYSSQTHFRARATGDTKQIYLIVTNPSDQPLSVNCSVEGM